ncbi:hypothetical protein HZA45_03340 [Candidatus Peregrinibacteria bacterium]|nr:hypothetical protein [Candidatus Peregrinibacteria bacterium]
MRNVFARIGTMLSLATIIAGLAAGPLSAHAAASPSYRFFGGSPDDSLHTASTSAHFALEGGLTWTTNAALLGAHFQISANPPDIADGDGAGSIPDWNLAPRLPGGGQSAPAPGGGGNGTGAGGTPSRRTTSAVAATVARAAPKAAAPKVTAPRGAAPTPTAAARPSVNAQQTAPKMTAPKGMGPAPIAAAKPGIAPPAGLISPVRPPRAGLKPAANKSPAATGPAAKTSQFFSPARSPAPAAQAPSNLSRAPSVSVRPGRRVIQRPSPVASLLNGNPVAESGLATLAAALTGGGFSRVVSLLPWIVTGVLILSILLEKARILFFTHFVTAPRRRASARRRRKATRARGRSVALLTLIAFLSCTLPLSPQASAAPTVPQKHIYNGHLLNALGQPIAFPVNIRFSYWKSPDALPTDAGSGSINTGAPNFVGWQEVQTVVPDGKGFFSLQMGSVVPLPNFSSMPTSTLLGLYLQVEVKPVSEPATTYELLDVDPGDGAVDRSAILSVPFALNADKLDARDTGTGSGSIMVLGSGGVIPVSAVPGATNQNTFTINNDDSATNSIALTFGKTLAKTLSYDMQKMRFQFNASLHVQGDLTVTGKINGVGVTAMDGTGSLKVFSGGGLNVKIGAGTYRINGNIVHFTGSGSVPLPGNVTTYLFFTQTGGLIKVTGGFPNDKSFIPLAQVTTSAGSVQTIIDRRAPLSDDREEAGLQVLHPAYDSVAYQADASDNVGQLSVTTDNSTLKNYYAWASSRSSLQDYDLLVRATLPPDFTKWRDGITLAYRSTSGDAANNKADVQVYDTNGNPVSLSGSVTNLTSTGWATTHIEFSGSPTWTAGSEFMMRLRVYAKNDFQMHIGDIRLNYTTLEKQ